MFLSQKSENNERIGIVAKLLALYFVMMPLDSIDFFGLGSLLKVIALLPILAILIYGRQNKYTINKLTGSLIIYTLIISVSYLYSIDLILSQSAVIRLCLNMTLIIFAGKIYDEYNDSEYKFLTKALVVGGFLNIILTFIFSNTVKDGRLTLAVAGSRQDPNYLNGYSLFALAYFSNLLFKEKKIWALFPILIIFVFTLSTGSRGALLASLSLVFVVVFYLYVIKHNVNPATIMIVAIIFVIVMIFGESILTLVAPRVLARYTLEYVENYRGLNRTDLWFNLLDVYAQSSFFRQLFGYGVNTVWIVETLSNNVAHNVWLEHLIANGLVGMISLIIMQWLFFRTALRTKDLVLISTYVAMMAMCFTLSLVSYKPIWNTMIMIMIADRRRYKSLNNNLNSEVTGE